MLTTNMQRNKSAEYVRPTDGCTACSCCQPRGHRSNKPGASPETEEGDDERVPTTPLQAGLPGLYIENGRVDAVLLECSS